MDDLDQQGFTVAEDAFSTDEIEELRGEIDRLERASAARFAAEGCG